ncbi:peptidylprolyl isomerase [Bacteroidia bacterium]|nr:peptidylprolyl isomerase [Bacteroidia bacterium]
MATLEKIRNKAGLLVTVIGVALFAFIIGDFLKSGSTFFRQSKQKIAIVDGEAIGIQEYQAKIEERTNNVKSRNNGMNLTEAMQNQIRQTVLDEMVGSILLNKESEKVGFAVGKEELADLIMGNNISPVIQQIADFQNPQTGRFDKNYLLQVLQTIEMDDLSALSPEAQQQILSAKTWWLSVEKGVLQNKLESKFLTLVSSAIVANSLDAKAAYDEEAVSVDFNYVSQTLTTIPDPDVEVADAEIAKLYAKRKNNLKQDAAKVIDYIAVNIVPSEEDYAEVAKRMDNLKDELAKASDVADIINENSEVSFLDAYNSTAQLSPEVISFVESSPIGSVDGPVLADNVYNLYKLIDTKQGPDSIKVSILNLPAFDSEARLTAFTDSVINVVKSGKTFSETALDLTNGGSDGSLGWATEAYLTQAVDAKFKDALFDAKLNEVFVVKSSMGTNFLVQITEKTKNISKYKIGTIQIEVTPSQTTYNKMYNDLNQYISKNNTLETFKTAASDAGYACQTDVPVYENQAGISAIEDSRKVIKWANSNKRGKLSEIFECQDYFIVAAVEGSLKGGFRSLKEVSDLLKRELINEKKGEKIVANLKAKNISSLDGYAAAMNVEPQEVKFVTFATQRITGIGVEPIVNAKAVVAEAGQITEPFAGKNAVYVLAVTDKQKSEQTFDVESQKQQINLQNYYRLSSTLQGSGQLLKENAKVEDNRSRFY